MKGPVGGRTDPEVPLDVGRDFVRFLGAISSVPSTGNPGEDFGHGADRAGLNQLDDAAVVVGGVDLRAHLRGTFCRGGSLGNHARFVNRVRERLFAVDVLAGFEGAHSGEGVRVVGGADDDGVERFIVEKFAEVVKFGRLAVLGGGAGEVAVVYVAEGSDVRKLGDAAHVVAAAAGNADDADIQSFIR